VKVLHSCDGDVLTVAAAWTGPSPVVVPVALPCVAMLVVGVVCTPAADAAAGVVAAAVDG